MTTLIYSGTLFSRGREMLTAFLPAEASENPVRAEFAILGEEICRLQYPDSDELDWKPFSPDSKFIGKISRLLSSIENESLISWGNSTDSLYLDYWKAAATNAGFVLFYSSPELELSHYINSHTFDASRVEKVINAWAIRTQALLTFFMNNRDRALLVNVQSTSFSNGSFTEAINKKFNLEIESGALSATPPHGNSALIEYLATTLLLKNHQVSELYDEVRSAATLISEDEKLISGVENRSKSLINAFLAEVAGYKTLRVTQAELETANKQLNDELETANKQLNDVQAKLEDELSLNRLQINQMQEELEFYFRLSVEQEKIADSVADYLSSDPLLRIARQARQIQ